MNGKLSTAGQFILSAAAFVVVGAGMKAAASLLVPFLLSIFIALICSPMLVWLRGKKVPTWAAITLIMLAIVASGTLVATIVGASIADFRTQMPSYQARLQEMSGGVQQWLAAKGVRIDAGQWRESFDPGVVMQLVGNVLDMPRLQAIAKKHGLPVVEDACQSLFGEWQGRRAGTFGIAAGFSMHPLKIINVWAMPASSSPTTTR